MTLGLASAAGRVDDDDDDDDDADDDGEARGSRLAGNL